MTTLSSIFSPNPSIPATFALIQSTAVQSALPLLRAYINAKTKHTVVLVCTLYAPSVFVSNTDVGAGVRGSDPERIKILDWTNDVKGFCGEEVDWDARVHRIRNIIEAHSSTPICLVLDSVDTIEDDIESTSKTYRTLQTLLKCLTDRNDTSTLTAHITSHSPLLPLLTTPRFNPSLIHLTTLPSSLLTHLSKTYLVPPPSPSQDPTSLSQDVLKFWRVYVPLVERKGDVERVVVGRGGDGGAGGVQVVDSSNGSRGPGGTTGKGEFIVDVIIRSRGMEAMSVNAGLTSRRKGVERVLEGWEVSKTNVGVGGCPKRLDELESLRGVWKKGGVGSNEEAPDPTKNLTFSLSLTESQQASKANVPLPYEHGGKPSSYQNQNVAGQGQIYYDPDSADDLDDEDPDEDLDL